MNKVFVIKQASKTIQLKWRMLICSAELPPDPELFGLLDPIRF
jgi:hypothetical protein